MADRPILFSAPMVRAILREIEAPGTGKTQTRRIIKPEPRGPLKEGDAIDGLPGMYSSGDTIWPLIPGWSVVSNKPGPHPDWVKQHVKFAVGDRLWVRESLERANGGEAVGYPADLTWLPNTPWEWKRDRLPSIHMPRRLSRITLTVTDVRVQRLQEISDVDAIAEGILTFNRVGYLNDGPLYGLDEGIGHDTPVGAFNHLWRSINGDGSWAANPFVVAITFRPILANIDSVEARAA